MNAEKYESFRKVVVWVARLYFVYMAFMLLYPRPPVPRVIDLTIDFVHLGAFGVLGSLVALARKQKSNLFWFSCLMIWNVGSECIQPLTGRLFEWIDIAQNVVGVTLGFWLAVRLRSRFVKDVNVTTDPEKE